MVVGSYDKIDLVGLVVVRILFVIFEKLYFLEYSGVVKEVEFWFEIGFVICDDMEMLEDIVLLFVCEGV